MALVGDGQPRQWPLVDWALTLRPNLTAEMKKCDRYKDKHPRTKGKGKKILLLLHSS
jgi:hypothetical protein